ncbi:hypothetical protein PI124_g9272 [Phytophthora idaei]|nr:hypothetical protein PI124_g9272 [Phytophthora idaei]
MDSHSGGKCPSSWPNNLNDLNDLNDHSDVSMRQHVGQWKSQDSPEGAR